ncbi:MAG: hypothetical protein K9K75_02820 [Deltaproteobacteria bacterium]|nr:hypothetical protein [Deltaproteobacteria bacterium]
MRIVNEEILCGVCQNERAIIFCDGCDLPLCANCRFFDLWGYGCGHVDTKVFCQKCNDDIKKNPYGGAIK